MKPEKDGFGAFVWLVAIVFPLVTLALFVGFGMWSEGKFDIGMTGVILLVGLYFSLVLMTELVAAYIRKSILLAGLLTIFTTFLLWSAYLEYTLVMEDGIVDQLRRSTLPNNEVRGWIFSLHFSVIAMACLICGTSGFRIYQVCRWLKSEKRN